MRACMHPNIYSTPLPPAPPPTFEFGDVTRSVSGDVSVESGMLILRTGLGDISSLTNYDFWGHFEP